VKRYDNIDVGGGCRPSRSGYDADQDAFGEEQS